MKCNLLKLSFLTNKFVTSTYIDTYKICIVITKLNFFLFLQVLFIFTNYHGRSEENLIYWTTEYYLKQAIKIEIREDLMGKAGENEHY